VPDPVPRLRPVNDGATNHGRHGWAASCTAPAAHPVMRSPWDTRVVYIERRQRWWWNAWRACTSTELSGFADSQEEATRAMYQAIEEAGPSPASDVPRSEYP
jgi:hypothetical protein